MPPCRHRSRSRSVARVEDRRERINGGRAWPGPGSEAAGGVLTAKQAPAGPAPPRRPVCAPRGPSSSDRRPPPRRRRTCHSAPSWPPGGPPPCVPRPRRPTAGPGSARGSNRSTTGACPPPTWSSNGTSWRCTPSGRHGSTPPSPPARWRSPRRPSTTRSTPSTGRSSRTTPTSTPRRAPRWRRRPPRRPTTPWRPCSPPRRARSTRPWPPTWRAFPPAWPRRASRWDTRSPGRSSTGGAPTARARRCPTRRGPTRATGSRPRRHSCRPWPRSGGT
jgi:hypothetical protein